MRYNLKLWSIIILISLFGFSSCKKDIDPPEAKFVPTDVLVKIKGEYDMNEIFDFINEYSHDVESISSMTCTSTLPNDSLDYVLDHINAKPFIDSSWQTTGYIHVVNQELTIFPKLFNMANVAYQSEWLETMINLELSLDQTSETAGVVIYFHVPEGTEKTWVTNFKQLEMVEWAELNMYLTIHPAVED